MILNHKGIQRLVNMGCVLNSPAGAISGTSIDIHLGSKILVESAVENTIDYRYRAPLVMREITLDDYGYRLAPGEFILAHTVEHLAFPADVSALLRTKSSMGRIGLEHLDAGWIDPGFHGSLTLELVNVLRHQSILIRPGDAIGQLVIFEHEAVAEHMDYRNRGRYGGSATVEQTRAHPGLLTP